jgi:membrane protein implicated in regulation of membrane protease activity
MRSTILQLGVAGLVIAGFVVLTLKGSDTSGFVALVAPILAAVFVIQHLDVRSDKQDEKLAQQDEALAKITHQTNGVLTERIEKAVNNALNAQGPGEDRSDVTPRG